MTDKMTPTECLRKLLDERGVEWTYADGTVSFNDGKHWYHAWAYNDGAIVVSMGYLTPEQAVEATLGRGTCKVEGSIDYGEFGCWQYDLSCGCRIIWPDNEPPTFCPECGRKVGE